MKPYVITTKPETDQEVGVTLCGPGLNPSGKYYVFRTKQRTETFIEAVNFAYQQGIAEGLRRAHASREPGRLLVVSGRTPDNLHVRPERWRERLVRKLRHALGR